MLMSWFDQNEPPDGPDLTKSFTCMVAGSVFKNIVVMCEMCTIGGICGYIRKDTTRNQYIRGNLQAGSFNRRKEKIKEC